MKVLFIVLAIVLSSCASTKFSTHQKDVYDELVQKLPDTRTETQLDFIRCFSERICKVADDDGCEYSHKLTPLQNLNQCFIEHKITKEQSEYFIKDCFYGIEIEE